MPRRNLRQVTSPAIDEHIEEPIGDEKTNDSIFKARFYGQPITSQTLYEAETVVYNLVRELVEARARGDVAAVQALERELRDAKSWTNEQVRESEEKIHRLREKHDVLVREVAEHEGKAEARRRNPPPGKRVVPADVNPYMNRIGLLLDDDDAEALEQWEQARRQGYSDPWEKDRKRIKWGSLALIAIIVVALAIWLFS